MDELLRELIETPGVPGYEERVRDLIASRLTDPQTDAMGNLVATINAGGGDGPALMFVAHMDEIGFVISEVRDDGYLKLKPLGGIDPRTVFGRSFRIVTKTGELTGVATVVPPHLMRDRAKEMADIPPVIDLVVDIGASSRDEALGMGVDILDFAVMHKQLHTLNDKYLCARGLDDRVGCYILLKAMERIGDTSKRVHFAFSTQEEVGLRGAGLLARSYPVEMAFAVDSVSAADFPGVRADLGPARLGAGPCLRVLDNAAIVSREFTESIRAIAADAGIELQVVFSGGGTDARAFQSEGPKIMPLTIPMRYTHSAVEMVHLDDVEQTIKLVCAIVDA